MNDRGDAPRNRARRRANPPDSRAGQAMIEFVLGAAVLIVSLLVVFELGRNYYARYSVRSVVSEAARLAASGGTLVNPDTGEPMTHAESVVYYIESSVGRAPVTLESVTLDPADGGGPGDLVEIRARYRFNFTVSPIVRPFAPSSLIFTVTSVVKNQPSS